MRVLARWGNSNIITGSTNIETTRRELGETIKGENKKQKN